MARWLKIGGTSYNLEEVGALSLEDFRTAGKHSFSKGVGADDLKAVHKQLRAVAGMAEGDIKRAIKSEEPLVKGGGTLVNADSLTTNTQPGGGVANEGGEPLVYTPEVNLDKTAKNGNAGNTAGKGTGRTGAGK